MWSLKERSPTGIIHNFACYLVSYQSSHTNAIAFVLHQLLRSFRHISSLVRLPLSLLPFSFLFLFSLSLSHSHFNECQASPIIVYLLVCHSNSYHLSIASSHLFWSHHLNRHHHQPPTPQNPLPAPKHQAHNALYPSHASKSCVLLDSSLPMPDQSSAN